jgi:hypothetical protein
MTAATETKTPSAIDAKDALDACKQSLGVLYCAMDVSNRVDSDDVAGALGLAVSQLHQNLQIVRDHFGMDKEEAASC